MPSACGSVTKIFPVPGCWAILVGVIAPSLITGSVVTDGIEAAPKATPSNGEDTQQKSAANPMVNISLLKCFIN
jgi:hypothetical protein